MCGNENIFGLAKENSLTKITIQLIEVLLILILILILIFQWEHTSPAEQDKHGDIATEDVTVPIKPIIPYHEQDRVSNYTCRIASTSTVRIHDVHIGKRSLFQRKHP